MKQSKTIFLIFCLSIFTSCQNGDGNLKSKDMLWIFYKSYIGEIANAQNLKQMEIRLDSLKNLYCTKSLIDSVNVEFKNGLDYDPFIKAQDADSNMLKTLSVSNIESSKNKYLIEYKNSFSTSKTKIYVTVVDEDGRFKISALN